MVSFIKDILRSSKANKYTALVAAALWVLIPAMAFLTVKSYRVWHHYSKARQYYREGGMQGAIREAQLALDIDPDFGQAASLLGKISLAAGDYGKAETFFDWAKSSGETAEALNGEGVALLVRGHYARGKELLNAAAELPHGSGHLGDVFVNLGNLALHADDLPAAEAYFQKAISARNVRIGGIARLYNGIGVLKTRQADKLRGADKAAKWEEAETEFLKAAMIEQNNGAAACNRLLLALARMTDRRVGSEERNSVLRDAEAFCKRQSDPPPALVFALQNELGLKAYADTNFDEAITAFEAALNTRSRESRVRLDYSVPRFNLAVAALAAAARAEGADDDVAALVEGLAKDTNVTPSEKMMLLAKLGVIEEAKKNRAAALNHLLQAAKMLKSAPKHTDAATVHHALAGIAYREGRKADALNLIGQAMEADPAITDLKPLVDRLKTPPRVSDPYIMEHFTLPPNLQPIKAEVYNRSTDYLLEKKDIVVKLDGTPVDFEFAEMSQIVALPNAPLADGLHMVTIDAVDPLGNEAHAKTEFRIDGSPPMVYAVNPAAGSKLAPGKQTIVLELVDANSAIDHSTLSLTAQERPTSGSAGAFQIANKGKFVYDIKGIMDSAEPIKTDKITFQLKNPLLPGEYTFSLQVADVRGNKLDYQWRYTVEETSP